jgi:pSer/pThr/pTyr-binding forkhead associated (FHA) protein
MILQLLVTKKSSQDFKHNLEFFRYPVVIGREDKNDVVLPDNLKVVSRKHARIIDTDGILQLVDLGSANSTYLNGERLRANEEYPLQSKDIISIGDYELCVTLLSEKKELLEDDQKTMIFTNPFTDDAASIIESFKILAAKYTLEQSPMKDDLLKMSFQQQVDELDKNETNKFLAGIFPELFGVIKTPEPAAGVPYKQEIKKSEPVQPKVEYREHTSLSIPEEKYLGSHFSNTVDVLLETFIKLIQGFLHFRQEFFGVTIYHTIPTGSLQEIKQYLFSPENSSEEEKKKLNLLEEETKKLLNHQVGLLEGYRESVMHGTGSFLQSLDPDVIEKEYMAKVNAAGGFNLSKFLPFIVKGKVLEVLKENYRKNLSDPYHIEKRYFRPLFLKGYQTRTHK